MLQINLTADFDAATNFLSQLASQRVPNAAAKALTGTAFDARDEVRKTLTQRFTLRRPWVSRGIGITTAKPRTLMAQVFSRDRFMAAHETGGVNPDARPIPIGRLGQTAQSRVLPRSQWVAPLQRKSNVFYHAGMLFERNRNGIQALYLLRPKGKTQVRARLGMGATVRSVALREFRRQMERAMRAELGR